MKHMDVLRRRRSVYEFTDESVAPQLIETLVAGVLTLTPSAFNEETQRVLLLFGEQHLLLWQLVEDEISKTVSEKAFARSQAKINGFRKAQGTILFFDDDEATKALQAEYPLYSEAFARWSLEQNGMLQINVWNALAEQGIGASLQHYNELIAKQVETTFGVPAAWRLLAQMPFGKYQALPAPKEKQDVATRMLIRK